MDLRRVWCLCSCIGLLAFSGARALPPPLPPFWISSPAFHEGGTIPLKYGFHGQNISPELRVEKVPAGTRSLVLIVDDPDAPSGLWTHWLVWNLPANTTSIPEGKLPPGAVQGKNSSGHVRYDGPAPPSGTHRYFFRLYALQTMLSLPAGSSRGALEAAMSNHYMVECETFGVYSASP
jgi:hypothetical protein